MNDTSARVVSDTDREVVDRVNRYVLDNAVPIIEQLNRTKALVEARLEEKTAELKTAEEEAERLRRELNGRPSKTELDAANAQVVALRGEIDALTTKANDLELQLLRRPSNPDQLEELIRADLDPVFERLRKEAEA